MKDVLTLPIRVEALVVQHSVSVVTTADGFQHLPYVNKQFLDVRFDTANLASSIDSPPLNSYRQLPRGVHLHWMLPEVMNSGTLGEGGVDLPEVPNRWLVRRQYNGQVQNWIVESDYCYPRGVVPDRAIAIPALNDAQPGDPPFQYIGRQMTLEQWQAESQTLKNNHRYLPRLTALGWGSPYFAALYPDCFSVFGFHDEELSGEEVLGCEYEVYGWYSHEQKDYVPARLLMEDDLEAFLNKAKWDLQVSDLNGLKHLVCNGKVTFDQQADLRTNPAPPQVGLTMADSPEEAVATYVAKRQTLSKGKATPEAVKLENQVLAVLFNDQVEGQDIDHVNHLKAARHQAAFQSVSGGDRWALNNLNSLLEENSDEEVREQAKSLIGQVRKTLAKPLQHLNELQGRLNKAHERCNYHRRMLYNDWSKYMLSLHPIDLGHEGYPDLDMMRLLMRQQTIPALEQAIEAMENYQSQVVLQAGRLEQDYLKWKEQFSDMQLPDKLLQLVPDQPYWKPRDPSLVLSGPSMVRPKKVADLLPCKTHATDGQPVDVWLIATATSGQWQWDEHAINQWDSQPSKPLLMEWSANLHPEQVGASIQGNSRDYPENFLVTNYRIPLNDDHLGLPSAGTDLQRGGSPPFKTDPSPTIIKGRSLLSAANLKIVQRKLDQFLQDQDSAEEAPGEIMKQVHDQLRGVTQLLAEDDLLIMDLEGLHRQLLMYSDLTMLEVNDPFILKDPEHLHVSRKVRGRLNGHSFLLPTMGHPFTPIKTGITRLGDLQLVDTFGKVQALNCENLDRPGLSATGNTVYTPPRLMQPTRLSFNWIDNHQPEGSSPIQGWLGYNLFDETLMYFDASGVLLGLINSDGEWTDERGIMLSLSTSINRPLREFILKCLSFHHHNRIRKGAWVSLAPKGETTWKELVRLGVIRELTEDKGLLIPMNEKDWTAQVEPVIQMSYKKARDLFAEAHADSNYWPKLKQAIRRAIDQIEPAVATLDGNPGTIKPLAIAKARLDLQAMGGIETDKNWSAIRHALTGKGRLSRNYAHVKFPVKLGEFGNLDDGLVGYWQVSSEDRLLSDGYFPQSDIEDSTGFIDAANFNPKDHDFVDQLRGEGVANLNQSLASPATDILMIMDPEAPVHATTGILPRKALRLPVEGYREVVKKITGRIFLAPILTPMSELAIPVPEANDWKWEMATGDASQPMIVTMDRDLISKEAFLNEGATEHDWHVLLEQAYVDPVPNHEDLAWVHLSEEMMDKYELGPALQQQLQRVIQKGLKPPESLPILQKGIHAVEGWLSPAHFESEASSVDPLALKGSLMQ